MISYDQYETLISGNHTGVTQEELFEYYVETLRAKQIVKNPDQFQHLRAFIPMIGFFLLIPGTSLSMHELMERVHLNGKAGKCLFDKEFVSDTVETMHWHYLCIDADDGRMTLDKSPADGAHYLAEINRLGYVIKEGIFHLMYFPDILTHHWMDVPGSRYFGKFIPRFYTRGDRVNLYTRIFSRTRLGKPHPAGCASCAKRIAF